MLSQYCAADLIPGRTRFHYDDNPPEEQNWSFPLGKDEESKAQVDDIPPLCRQLKHFISAARGQAEPNCSVEDGLKTVLVIEAIFQSLSLHSPVVIGQL
jgi:predicted dehydrogenase